MPGPLERSDEDVDLLQHELPVDLALRHGGEELESAFDAPRDAARVSRTASTDASNGPSVCQASEQAADRGVAQYDPRR